MKANNLTIATWVLAGLLIATVLLLAFAPLTEGLCDGGSIPTTIFQNPATLGPMNIFVHVALSSVGITHPTAECLIRDGFVNAALYLIGMVVFLVAAQCLPLRYGLSIASVLFSLFTYPTIVCIRGLVEGWVKLPAWSLFALGTLFSSGFLWLKLVELLRSKKRGTHDGVPAVQTP
ncbi:MAG: hypothetical protein WC708_06845 [Lentisphaeria bacterium]